MSVWLVIEELFGNAALVVAMVLMRQSDPTLIWDVQPRRVREDGRVFEVEGAIETRYLNAGYVLAQDEPAALSLTGWLRIFTLAPIAGAGPSFEARWDGGSREPGKIERYDLDIDISGVSSEEARLFKKSTNGYSGHHATRISGNAWDYEVAIKIPRGAVFEAVVRLRFHRKLEFSETLPLQILGR
jgi:hypothetical protein